MSIPWLLALRYMRGRKLRTFLTTLAVIFGVMIIFGLNSLIPSMMQTFRQNMLATAGKVDITVTSDIGLSFGQEKLDQLRAVNGIAQATGSLQQTVTIPSSLGGDNPVSTVTSLMVVGIDPESWVGIHSYALTEGRYLSAADEHVVVLSQTLADKLHLVLGDTLVIPSSGGEAELEIVGILNTLPTTGVEQIYINLPVARQILNHPDQINVLEAMLANGSDRTTVQTAVENAMGSGYHIGPLEYGDELMSSLKLGETAMTLIGGLAIIMGGFIIFNTFRTVVNERRRDLGMLRAIGASRRTLMHVIVIESLLQGIIGTILGLLAGVGIAYLMVTAINPTLLRFLHFKMGAPVFSTGNLATAVVMGIGITVLSGWMPARSATRVTPLEALRPQVGADIERAARVRGWIGAGIILVSGFILILGKETILLLGALLFTVGLVLVAPLLIRPISRGFGELLSLFYTREGPIARGNIARNPGRSAVTAAAMMIGLALVISIFTLMTSVFDVFHSYLDETLGADYLLMPPSLVLGGGNLGASGDLAERLAELPDVEEITTLRQATTAVDGSGIQLIGIDPVTYPRVVGLEFTQGESDAAFAALYEGNAVIVNGVFAMQNQIQMGDTIQLTTADGVKPYRVVGIAMDYLNAKLATGYISKADLSQDFHQNNDVLLLVNRRDGADSTTVRQQIQDLIRDYPAFSLLEYESFKKSQEESLNGAMVMLYALMLMMALPGLIAMINTLAISVIERTREIGLLRAVGSTRRQVRHMIMIESLLLAIAGVGFGILAGLFLGYAFIGAMQIASFSLRFLFPYQGVLVALACGLIIGVLAAGVPARQAAQMDVVKALQYE